MVTDATRQPENRPVINPKKEVKTLSPLRTDHTELNVFNRLLLLL